MNILRIFKPQERRKVNNIEPQTKFTGSFKKMFLLLIINSKFYYG